MCDMMDDINKYAAIWDAAQEKDIFKDAPKPPKPRNPDAENSFFGSDFFGQNHSPEYDIDAPLNEVDSLYWKRCAQLADHSGQYVDPLTEVTAPSKEETKDFAGKMASTHNPVYPNTLGKDQDIEPTQNWGVGGKEHFQLEDLKSRLEKLESKLNAMEAQGESSKDTQTKIDSIKKQIDDLSDSLSGNRLSNDG